MKSNRSYILVGILLVVIGFLFLLQNFGVFGGLENLIWTILFGAGGVAFLGVFFSNQEHWWAIIPGFTLLGLAFLIGFGEYMGAWGGALFLGAIGLSFWVIYLLRRDFWWAIIPGGALMTLALVAGLSGVVQDDDGMAIGGILFLGFALTFLLVYLAPTPQNRMRWALIPAGILGVMGVLFLLSLGGFINYALAVGLILVGGFLVVRTLMRK